MTKENDNVNSLLYAPSYYSQGELEGIAFASGHFPIER